MTMLRTVETFVAGQKFWPIIAANNYPENSSQ